MPTTLVLVRRVKRNRQRHDEGKEVWRGSKQESNGAVVAQSADNRREEIVEGLSCDEGHLEDDKHVQFGIDESLLDSPPDTFGILVNNTSIFLPNPPFLFPSVLRARVAGRDRNLRQ